MDWFHSFTISFLYLSFFLYQGLGAMALYLTSYTRRDKGVLVVPFGPLCNWKDFLGPINVFVLGGGGGGGPNDQLDVHTKDQQLPQRICENVWSK